MDRWGIIIGHHTFQSRKDWRKIQQHLEAKGVVFDMVQSESYSSVERLAEMLCRNGYKTIVLIGNDATLNEAVNGILSIRQPLPEDFAFGIIPYGIGNAFASFWDIDTDNYRKAIDNILVRRTRTIDVGRCQFNNSQGKPQCRYFLNCVNIGLGAKLVELTNRWHRLMGSKRLSLLPVFIAQIFERKSFNIRLKADTETVARNVMSICIGNATGYGQTPNAVPYNGLLDMSVTGRPTVWQLLRGFWLLGKGQFLNNKNVHPYRIQAVTLFESGRASISLDGSMLPEKYVLPLNIGIEKDRINFIISCD